MEIDNLLKKEEKNFFYEVPHYYNKPDIAFVMYGFIGIIIFFISFIFNINKAPLFAGVALFLAFSIAVGVYLHLKNLDKLLE